jgi:DNA-binding NtrC family response regulator
VVESLTESELFGHEKGAFTGATDRREGCFEQANGGTLFLDEIGDASPAFQAKLLRVLDRGEFLRVGGQHPISPDVRLVAATNVDLEAKIASGKFRGDLYYRINEVTLNLPALRNRREDIPLLVQKLHGSVNRKNSRQISGLSDEAVEELVTYHWPGNVRELQNVLTRSALNCRGSVLQSCHLQGLQTVRGDDVSNHICTLAEMERTHIKRVLGAVQWNRGRACRLLGITRPTLRRKMRLFNMEKRTEETEPESEEMMSEDWV